ncbi:Arc family DNA-binding protein [Pedomonas mirosovicensis]|uniref:Arc family DNA-binding protein n=1 Tax=Pedomonas mirosovicensis TaxID=2908641 RepID=UPI0021672113|nr:Arc family DNA-binding protein [Pedomonas mirosovicensis]MCH8685876.1 Arc family DNA-binding protein [Pedomonas mirosovicensis]
MASITPYGLRMPRELKDALEAAARQNGRSLNSEIVARLEASVQTDACVPDFVTPELFERVKVLGQEMETLRAQVRALEIRANAKGQ